MNKTQKGYYGRKNAAEERRRKNVENRLSFWEGVKAYRIENDTLWHKTAICFCQNCGESYEPQAHFLCSCGYKNK